MLRPFDLEHRVYERLRAAGAARIRGFTIPVLLSADPRLGVLELSRVEPPYVLDFAAVTIDETPEEKWADQPGRMQAARARAEDSFADHTREQWAEVEALYEDFGERFGVRMLDLHPGNIALGAALPPAAG